MMMTNARRKYYFIFSIQSGLTDSSSALTKILVVLGTWDGVKFPADRSLIVETMSANTLMLSVRVLNEGGGTPRLEMKFIC